MTFGCFNNPAKLSPPALAGFAAVLRRVPGSRLVLKYKGVEIYLLDETSLMHTRTLKSIDGCVTIAKCKQAGLQRVVLEESAEHIVISPVSEFAALLNAL